MTNETDDLHAEPAGLESGLPEFEATPETEAASEPEFTPQPRPPAKLERLQKILAAAGVASRRSAESMIEQGRVQVNGKIVTELGTKADAARDHIRVDGKLLQGPERLRYFVLNKPRGFVTTVKDPEGRPTVMQFFDKMKERLYPVGRLDYLSEGLLVVTNDGELANKLTKASSGVEKTYLVKVAGQPTEAELDILRGGVSISLGQPGSRQIRTSPARIRQVRQGDNPWYEVVLIEGRNRELRKMFEQIGHFVEKIRRTGYGPLVLDQEPGNLRELQPEELDALRKAADGKLRTPKSKELRRRNLLDSQLPTLAPKPSSRPRPAKPLEPKSFEGRPVAADRPSRNAAPFAKSGDKPFRAAARTAWKKNDHPTRPPARFSAGSTGAARPRPDRSRAGSPTSSQPGSSRPSRGESGLARPFTTSSGKPRAGGARPSSKPGRPSSSSRPYTPRAEGASGYRPAKAKPYPNSTSHAERKAGPGWKSVGWKPSFSSAGKPASGSHSKPKPGGFSKSGYKGKPAGKKRKD
jgi:23S rRNA pseudouridine2605 synthase